MNSPSSQTEHDEDGVSSDHEYYDDDKYYAMAVLAATNNRRGRRRDPQPMHNSLLTGRMRVEEILNGHEDVILTVISMKSATFRSFSDLLRRRQLLKPTRNMDVDEQLCIFLSICAQGATIRQIAYLFQHSVETTSRWFYEVLQVICSLKDEFICPPDYTDVQPLIQENAYKYRPWFDGCVGAIDGTHVPCVPPEDNSEGWINRKGYCSQNVLAACSFDMRFTYMLAGFEGSCHDAFVLDEAIAIHGFPIPPPGKFYLADSGYANRDCFLSPFRRETYHLPEYRTRRGGLRNRREVFNYTHSSLRNCIERTFGVWKSRFKILKGVNSYPMGKQKMIPIACAVLHNYIRMVEAGDPVIEEDEADCELVSETADVNSDYVLDDGIEVPEPSIGPHDDVSNRGAMNQVREMMANDMWVRYQISPWYRTS